MATDRAEYVQGDTVRMLYKITNLRSNSITFTFPSSQCFDFYVSDSCECEIWRWSFGMYFDCVVWEITLEPNGSLLATYEWDMNDSCRHSVLPGTYEVTGTLAYMFPMPRPVSVQIIVNPSLVIEITASVLPSRFSADQNLPNPFNPVTQINYTLPRDCLVKLDIFNLLGQKVGTLLDGKQKAGYKTARWNASSFSSGIYFYRLQAGDFVQTRKMVLIR